MPYTKPLFETKDFVVMPHDLGYQVLMKGSNQHVGYYGDLDHAMNVCALEQEGFDSTAR